MIKKVILLFIAASVILQSCGQNKKNKNMNDISIKDSILNMYKQVQSFDYNPRFVLDFSVWNCTYQVLVNDVPVMNSNEEGNVNGAVYPFSNYILQSGEQTITIRLFPEMKEGYKRERFLTEKAGMKIKVQEGDFYRQKPKDYKTIYEFETPTINQDSLPYIEFKGVFETKVPRVLEGWTNGVDLTKEDKDKLQKEVVAKYEDFRQCFEKKNVFKYTEMIYHREIDFAKSFYQNSSQQSEEKWHDINDRVNEVIKTYSIKNPKIVLYGYGKIIGLEDSLKQEDLRETAIYGETRNSYRTISLLLYRPKPGAPLEVIR